MQLLQFYKLFKIALLSQTDSLNRKKHETQHN